MPFTQTMRSLSTDRAQLPLILLIVILLLILAWLAWFLLAPIKRYETLAPLQLPLSETIVAHFPVDSIELIKPGQFAMLHLKRNGGQDEANLPAQVMDVTIDNQSEVQVWLKPQFDDSFFDASHPFMINRIDVEIDQTSPLLLLRQIYRQAAPASALIR